MIYNGKEIHRIAEKYGITDEPFKEPSVWEDKYSDELRLKATGKFLLCRRFVLFTDGSNKYSEHIIYIPKDGKNGMKGMDGKDGALILPTIKPIDDKNPFKDNPWRTTY